MTIENLERQYEQIPEEVRLALGVPDDKFISGEYEARQIGLWEFDRITHSQQLLISILQPGRFIAGGFVLAAMKDSELKDCDIFLNTIDTLETDLQEISDAMCQSGAGTSSEKQDLECTKTNNAFSIKHGSADFWCEVITVRSGTPYEVLESFDIQATKGALVPVFGGDEPIVWFLYARGFGDKDTFFVPERMTEQTTLYRMCRYLAKEYQFPEEQKHEIFTHAYENSRYIQRFFSLEEFKNSNITRIHSGEDHLSFGHHNYLSNEQEMLLISQTVKAETSDPESIFWELFYDSPYYELEPEALELLKDIDDLNTIWPEHIQQNSILPRLCSRLFVKNLLEVYDENSDDDKATYFLQACSFMRDLSIEMKQSSEVIFSLEKWLKIIKGIGANIIALPYSLILVLHDHRTHLAQPPTPPLVF